MISTLLHLFNIEIEVDNYNDDFLLLRSSENKDLANIGKAIFQRDFDFIDEVIVTEAEICLKLNAQFQASDLEVLKNIEQKQQQDILTYQLPVYFNDHEDWQQVESHSGFSKDEIISKICSSDLSIAMFGFLPGFIYINGLEPSLHIPRKTVPAKYVEANSIALGGKYLGIYSLDSPGGWHVIGQLPIPVLQLPQIPPVPLNLGDKINLEPISKQKYESLLQQKISLKEYNAQSRNY